MSRVDGWVELLGHTTIVAVIAMPDEPGCRLALNAASLLLEAPKPRKEVYAHLARQNACRPQTG